MEDQRYSFRPACVLLGTRRCNVHAYDTYFEKKDERGTEQLTARSSRTTNGNYVRRLESHSQLDNLSLSSVVNGNGSPTQPNAAQRDAFISLSTLVHRQWCVRSVSFVLFAPISLSQRSDSLRLWTPSRSLSCCVRLCLLQYVGLPRSSITPSPPFPEYPSDRFMKYESSASSTQLDSIRRASIDTRYTCVSASLFLSQLRARFFLQFIAGKFCAFGLVLSFRSIEREREREREKRKNQCERSVTISQNSPKNCDRGTRLV